MDRAYVFGISLVGGIFKLGTWPTKCERIHRIDQNRKRCSMMKEIAQSHQGIRVRGYRRAEAGRAKGPDPQNPGWEEKGKQVR